MNINLPGIQNSSSEGPSEKSLNIEISKEGKVFINDKEVENFSFKALNSELSLVSKDITGKTDNFIVSNLFIFPKILKSITTKFLCKPRFQWYVLLLIISVPSLFILLSSQTVSVKKYIYLIIIFYPPSIHFFWYFSTTI